MLNDCSFIGRLGKQVELRQTSGNKEVATFSIAVSKKWKNKQSGEMQEKTTWINVVVWGNQASSCNNFLNKGSLVHVRGELEIRQYEKNDGTTGYATEVIANNVIFLSPKSDNNSGKSDGYGDFPQEYTSTGEDVPF